MVSGRGSLPVGLSPSPFSTVPRLFRSTFQLSVSPALFFRVKAKVALACLMAFLRSASLELRAVLMASKASEEGKAAMRKGSAQIEGEGTATGGITVLERHGDGLEMED